MGLGPPPICLKLKGPRGGERVGKRQRLVVTVRTQINFRRRVEGPVAALRDPQQVGLEAAHCILVAVPVRDEPALLGAGCRRAPPPGPAMIVELRARCRGKSCLNFGYKNYFRLIPSQPQKSLCNSSKPPRSLIKPVGGERDVEGARILKRFCQG